MDPRNTILKGDQLRLPRACGDGPFIRPAAASRTPASPRLRGWTPAERGVSTHQGGFPAPAGMDPEACGTGGSGCRLPRACGDGPFIRPGPPRRNQASPRLRGWTPSPSKASISTSGFPAPAGMDPCRRLPSMGCSRLPRACGDGPAPRRLVHRDGRASPRLRGWTLLVLVAVDAGRGFPAPAGMDPRTRIPRSTSRGLPRACGDGPDADTTVPRTATASPRLRGWTAVRRHIGADRPGFPAPAGMDLGQRSGPGPPLRLPRACGDGPGRRSASTRSPAASPRLRGWTLWCWGDSLEEVGFPAPAAMDPPCSRRRSRPGRLPRACGDGPAIRPGCRLTQMASPRLRGWTFHRPGRHPRRRGFPAPAGMDRCRRRPKPWPPRLPRACGDGPEAGPVKGRKPALPRACGDGPPRRSSCARKSWASPRLRGWTRRPATARRGGAGFPAPAGMDPLRPSATTRAMRLPRACGDGPGMLLMIRSWEWASPRLRGWTADERPAAHRRGGFPAPAGMDLRRRRRPPARARLPRACGDGPPYTCESDGSRKASPRLRGWTRLPAARGDGRGGFPAPAGMDRSRRAGARGSLRLPRACGDGPCAGTPRAASRAASPRLRGWTSGRRGGLGGVAGFPAPAGMDPAGRVAAGAAGRLPRACGDGSEGEAWI